MKGLVILIAIFLSSLCNAARVNVDSLLSLWNDHTQNDSIRFYALHDIIRFAYIKSQPDSALFYVKKEQEFARQRHLIVEYGVAVYDDALVHEFLGDYVYAIKKYKEALQIFEEQNSSYGKGISLQGLANVYMMKGYNVNALKFYQRSMREFEVLMDRNALAACAANVGIIYARQGDFEKAIDHFQQSIQYYRETNVPSEEAVLLGNLGAVYGIMKDFQRSLEFHRAALALHRELNDKSSVSRTLSNIGGIYGEMGELDTAMVYFQKAADAARESGNFKQLSSILVSVGQVASMQNRNQEAIKICRESYAIAKRSESAEIILDASQCLFDQYQKLGNADSSLFYYMEMQNQKDSIQANATSGQLQAYEFTQRLVTDSLQTEEEKLRTQLAHESEMGEENRKKNIYLFSGILMVLVAGGLIYQVRQVRKSRSAIASERDRSEHLLLNILPAEIADELKEKGEAGARDYEDVTVLFTDFKGFTETSEKMTPTDLVDELNVCFKAFDHICEKYGVEKIKTIGDAYMAAGGLPAPSDNAVANTVKAGLEMADFIEQRKKQLDAEGRRNFEMRTGIHTGPVVAGIVGIKKFQYDVWGDTVNTASRMESHGVPGQVNISASTYQMIKNDPQFRFEERGKIHVKGKGEVEMYFVKFANPT